MEGGSPSCCAGARGSTIRTTLAPPSGTATTRTMSTPTLASVPAVSPPPAPFTVRAAGRDSSGSTRGVTDPWVQTRSGDRRSPLARSSLSQRPHDPHSPGPLPHGPRDLGDTVGLCCAHTHHTDPAPRRRGLARAGLRQLWRGCGGEGIAGGGARQTRGWIGLLLLPPQGVLLSGELLAGARGSRSRSAVASSPRCVA